MKTPEEIKKGLKYLSIRDIVHKMDMWKEGIAYDYAEDAAADALAYIQQLETENHQLLTKAQQLESTISQVSKALCGKEKATLKELLQAADQLKARAPRWISVEERLPEINGSWPYCKHVTVLTKNKEVLPGLCNGTIWYVMRDTDAYCTRAYDGEVTHWMPRIEPPEEDDK